VRTDTMEIFCSQPLVWSNFRERYPRLFSDFLLHQQPLPDGPMEIEAVSGSCMLVRRDALLDIGSLDEGYFMHCEDLDWCMRFRQRGWKNHICTRCPCGSSQGDLQQKHGRFLWNGTNTKE